MNESRAPLRVDAPGRTFRNGGLVQRISRGRELINHETLSRTAAVTIASIAVMALSACASIDTASDSVQGIEHWVPSASGADGRPLKLYLREKRSSAVDASSYARSGRVALLVHGSGVPSSIVFDLQVPGKPALTYSFMDYLADQGFDVFSLDLQNYGRSGKQPCGLCVTTPVATGDVHAAVNYIRELRGVAKVQLLGWSSGNLATSQFAIEHPEKVSRLVQYAPPLWTGPRGKVPTEEFQTLKSENLRKGLSPVAPEDALATETFLKEVDGLKSPMGVFVDLNSKMPVIDPRRITVPTMVIVGSHDQFTPASHANFPGHFAALPSADKQVIIVPDAGHYMVMQKPRLRFYSEVAKWFSIE